jgi:transcriptional regulator with XRE-family HTH domain
MPVVYRNILAESVRIGLSREGLAEKLRMTRQTLRNKLCRISKFTCDELTMLSTITGKSIEYLLETKESEVIN